MAKNRGDVNPFDKARAGGGASPSLADMLGAFGGGKTAPPPAPADADEGRVTPGDAVDDHHDASSALVPVEAARAGISSGGEMEFPGERGLIRTTPTGLIVEGEIGPDEFAAFGYFLGTFLESLQWIVADYCLYGESVHGQTIDRLTALIGKSRQTLYNWVSVARAIPPEDRYAPDVLSYSAHAEVVRVPTNKRRKLLKRAADEGWGASKVRKEVKHILGEDEVPHGLAHPVYKTHFRNLLKAARGEAALRREDLDAMQVWLDDLRRNLE